MSVLSHFFSPNTSNSHFSLAPGSIVEAWTSLTHLFWFDFIPLYSSGGIPTPCLLLLSNSLLIRANTTAKVLWIAGQAISQLLSGNGTYGGDLFRIKASQVLECFNLGWNFKVFCEWELCVVVFQMCDQMWSDFSWGEEKEFSMQKPAHIRMLSPHQGTWRFWRVSE